MLDNLKVLWHSNAPYVGSGYGVQTDLVTRWLKQHGHTPVVSGFHGQRGITLNYGGVPVLPGSNESWGNDILAAHYDMHNPDVVMILVDAWIIENDVLKNVPVAGWCPVDHTPIPVAVKSKLKRFDWVVAMSRHGEREMRKAGLDPFYVPHMVDVNTYAPTDRLEAKRIWRADERYFVTTVAANKGYPGRKNLERLIKAWSFFIKDHPDALLYIHSMPFPTNGGWDLPGICELYDIPYYVGALTDDIDTREVNIIFPDVYRLTMGEYTPPIINTLYNAADLFVLPSAGEGFGVPIIEAQAAGCPVAITDWTAMSELGAAGYRIALDPIDDVLTSNQYSEQALPKISEIVKALEWGYQQRGRTALRNLAREFAQDYAVDTVMTRHMLPVLKTIAMGNKDATSFGARKGA